MQITCGVFIVNQDDEVLIVHPTNGNEWSIPKGHKKENELPQEAAFRETKEETGIDLNELEGDCFLVGESKYRHGKKKLIAFSFYLEDNYTGELKCTSLVDDSFPEVDDFRWVNLTEAKKLLHYTQSLLLYKL